MTDELTFEPNDERALAFIDTQDIIKHLEDLGYQVIDKSEHGDALKRIEYLEACLDASLSQNEEAYSLIRRLIDDLYYKGNESPIEVEF